MSIVQQHWNVYWVIKLYDKYDIIIIGYGMHG